MINELSEPRTFEEALDRYFAEAKAIMIKKQMDYGPRNILDCGEVGLVIRCNDKMARLKNLYGVTQGDYQKRIASNESILDTWLDLSNYSGPIAYMVANGYFNLPLEAKLNEKGITK